MTESFAAQLHQAAADLRAMSTEVRRDIRAELQSIAEPIAAKARANASWSTRIPGAIRVSVLKRGVEIKVSAKKAPHARPYEGITGEKKFRHPVHGNRDRWVSQDTRPFLEPAVLMHRDKIAPRLARVVTDAARRHGYR